MISDRLTTTYPIRACVCLRACSSACVVRREWWTSFSWWSPHVMQTHAQMRSLTAEWNRWGERTALIARRAAAPRTLWLFRPRTPACASPWISLRFTLQTYPLHLLHIKFHRAGSHETIMRVRMLRLPLFCILACLTSATGHGCCRAAKPALRIRVSR